MQPAPRGESSGAWQTSKRGADSIDSFVFGGATDGVRPEQTEAEVTRRLSSTLRSGSPNAIAVAVAQVREWAVEYDEELGRFADLAEKTHWNLWMMDAWLEDALFAVLVFRTCGVEFLYGSGDAFVIRRFAESDFPNKAEMMPAEMARLFALPAGGLPLGREAAEGWLGRGW